MAAEFQGRGLPRLPDMTPAGSRMYLWRTGHFQVQKCREIKCIMASVTSRGEIEVPPSVWFRFARRLHC